MSFVRRAKPIAADTLRLWTPAMSPAQVVRAVLVGMLFAFVFLWALPKYTVLPANGSGQTQTASNV